MKMKSGVGWLMIIGSCLPGGGCPPHSDEYKNTENGKWRAEEGPSLPGNLKLQYNKEYGNTSTLSTVGL